MGDGGCITTNDSALAGKLRMLRDHGRSSKYVHDFVGYNFRFNEIQAAIGRVELRNLDKLNEHRRDVAARYNDRLEGTVQIPPERPWARAVYHLYVICHPQRDRLQESLRRRGVDTLIHYPVPIHRQPAYHDLGYGPGSLPVTERVAREVLSLPMYVGLRADEIQTVAQTVNEWTAEVSRAA